MKIKNFIDYIGERLSILECFYEDIDGNCKCVLCGDAKKVIEGEIKQMKKDLKFLKKK